jgi:hypothetical protein
MQTAARTPAAALQCVPDDGRLVAERIPRAEHQRETSAARVAGQFLEQR